MYHCPQTAKARGRVSVVARYRWISVGGKVTREGGGGGDGGGSGGGGGGGVFVCVCLGVGGWVPTTIGAVWRDLPRPENHTHT